ncbi:hypothetical protein ES708_26169 [subsurface metagenome]
MFSELLNMFLIVFFSFFLRGNLNYIRNVIEISSNVLKPDSVIEFVSEAIRILLADVPFEDVFIFIKMLHDSLLSRFILGVGEYGCIKFYEFDFDDFIFKFHHSA